MNNETHYDASDIQVLEVLEAVRDLAEAGFTFVATGKTYELIKAAGFTAERIDKLGEGRPNVEDIIINKQVQLIINTPESKKGRNDGSYIRKSAIREHVPYITTMAAAKAAAEGIKHVKKHGPSDVKSLQEWHKEIQ